MIDEFARITSGTAHAIEVGMETATTSVEVTASVSYDIAASKVEACKAVLVRLHKKAAKVGRTFSFEFGKASKKVIEVTYKEGYEEHTKTETRLVVPVTITGDLLDIKIAGYKLVGAVVVIDDVKVVGGEIPVELGKAHNFATCEHCKIARNRNKSFLLQGEDGAYKWVGSTCLEDFTGHDVANAISSLAIFESMLVMLKSLGDDGDGFGYGKGFYDLEAVVALTIESIHTDGWLSKTKAQEQGRESRATARMVEGMLERGLVASEEDRAEAIKAVKWAEELTDEACTSDYLLNIREVARAGYSSIRLLGLAVSIAQAYMRATEAVEEKKVSNHVGEVGKKLTIEVTYQRHFSYDNPFGRGQTVRFIFADKIGNIVVWKTSTFPNIKFADGHSDGLLNGPDNRAMTIKLTATVKGHGEYKGTKQTEVIRAKLAE
jgi:hypothetical protein